MVQETRRNDQDSGAGPSHAEVAAWLVQHPDFLNQHPELLARMNPPPSTRPDGLVDLHSVMAERLRQAVERLEGRQRALLRPTRANHHNPKRGHSATLFQLDDETFEQP